VAVAQKQIPITDQGEVIMKQAQVLFCCASAFAGALAVAILTASPSRAADIIAEWATVKAPPAPELKPVR